MPKYYLAPTIGTGTDQDPYRPKVADYQCNWVAVYEVPEQASSIVAVNADEKVFAEIEQDAEILLLADSLDKDLTDAEFQRICPNGQLKAKKDPKDKQKNLKVEKKEKENKGEFLRRLIKMYAGENAELPRVY